MVSFGPDTQTYNYTHMVDFTDYRRDPNSSRDGLAKGMGIYDPVSSRQTKPCSGSIYDYFCRNSTFSKFKLIIDRAMMAGQLNQLTSPYHEFTVLAPPDKYLEHIPDSFFKTMDCGTARQILTASTIVKKVDRKLITSSPVAYYYTLNKEMRMYVTNINSKTQINNCAVIIGYDIPATNGVIHLVSNLIMPSNDTFMN